MTDMNAVLIAARRKILASQYVIPLLGTDIGQGNPGTAWSDGWVFRATDNNAAPVVNPANSGKASITMQLRDSWSSPSQYHTLRYRQLRFSIYADQTRIAGKNNLQVSNDADLRCSRISDALIAEFDDVANNDHNWPNNVDMVSCVLYNDLRIEDVPNNDGLVEGSLSFALVL